MTETRTISAQEFLRGDYRQQRHGIGTHKYTATWENGRMHVFLDGQPVPADTLNCGGTADNRTCYVQVSGVGFIGGWQYPHRKMPWRAMVAAINEGILYDDMSELPNGRKRK